MKKNFSFSLLFLGLLVLPSVAGAQTIDRILRNINNTLNILIATLFILETVGLLLGAARFILSGDPAKKKDAQQMMLWSVIAMAVTAAAWGIAEIIINYFGVNNVPIPTSPGQRGGGLLPPT